MPVCGNYLFFELPKKIVLNPKDGGNGTSANGNKTGAGKSGSDSHNDPNKWGSDAWWEEQERFINDSLYANHDWDIFKVEEARCDAEHCHDPYHHHEK